MSRRIDDLRLAAVHAGVTKARRREQAIYEIDTCDLACIIDELRQRREQPGRSQLGPTALLLTCMAVGDVEEIPPITRSALTSARRTARKQLANPDAHWESRETVFGTIRIRRLPDGAAYTKGEENPAVGQLAALQVGSCIVIGGLMYHGLKVKARLRLDDAGAQWTARRLATGDTRVTRTR